MVVSCKIRYLEGHGMTYATVGTVCAAALLGGLVDLDVLDNEVAGVKTLGVGVGLGVLEEREKELSALHGPAGLGDTESLAFRFTKSVSAFEDANSQFLVVSFFSSWISSGYPQYPYASSHMAIGNTRFHGAFTYLEQYGQCSRHISSWGRPQRDP